MNWLDILSPLSPPTENGQPLYAQLRDLISQSIQSGKLPVDAQLPTNREAARLLKIDRSTVSRAYAELARQGLIESHVGRGTFVRSTNHFANGESRQNLKADNNARQVLPDGNKINWSDKFSNVSRTTAELLAKQPSPPEDNELISFAGGSPGVDSIPYDQFQSVLNSLAADSWATQLFDYSPPEGDALLRGQVKRYLAGQNITVRDEELLILSGSQQGIDLVAACFVDPSDEVVVEQPTYFWALCNFRARQAKLLPIGLDEEGLVVEELENVLARHNPKLIYVMPDFQNPTGACLSTPRRQKLIELARAYHVPIFEDNFAGELHYEQNGLPPLRSLPYANEIVIHQGTFSKALCPGLRIGWLVAPPEVITCVRTAKRACDISTNSMAQIVLANYLKEGLYQEHLARVKSVYRRRKDRMLASLSKYMPQGIQRRNQAGQLEELKVGWMNPKGGLFIWVRLPDGFSSRDLLKLAEREGVSFSPGDLFFPNNDRLEFFRLCFIHNDEATIEIGIERLGKAVRKLFDGAVLAKVSRTQQNKYSASKSVLV
jgi:DNA-binding transcriptional MocR family regulator